MPEGVRLVTIGFNASLRPRVNSLQVAGLSPQLLAATIRTIVPGIDEERARSITSECHQSPKLAVLFAQLINEDPALLDPQRLLADGEVQNALDRSDLRDCGGTRPNSDWIRYLCGIQLTDDKRSHENDNQTRGAGVQR